MMNQYVNKCLKCENFPCTLVAEMFPQLMKEGAKREDVERKHLVDYLEHMRNLLWVHNLGFEKDPNIVMTIENFDTIGFCKKADVTDKFPDSHFEESAVVMDGMLVVLYDLDDVISLGDVEYLQGSALIQGIDVYGNECSVTRDDIENTLDYVEMALTEIMVDGKSYHALRLV